MIKNIFPFSLGACTLSLIGCSSEPTIYEKLAAIHEGTRDPSTGAIVKFTNQIDSMDRYCPETPEELANSVVTAYQTLEANGSSVSLLEFTDSMEDVVSETQPDIPCIQIAAALTTSMTAPE